MWLVTWYALNRDIDPDEGLADVNGEKAILLTSEQLPAFVLRNTLRQYTIRFYQMLDLANAA